MKVFFLYFSKLELDKKTIKNPLKIVKAQLNLHQSKYISVLTFYIEVSNYIHLSNNNLK